MAILFGGSNAIPVPVLPVGRSDAGAPIDLDLNGLSDLESKCTFFEWITQCWIADVDVPTDPESLARFDINELVPSFLKRSNADRKRIRVGRGVTAEEYLLFAQLVTRRPLALVMNAKYAGLEESLRVKKIVHLKERHLGACIIRTMVQAVRVGEQGGFAVMIYDGKTGHVISLRGIDKSTDWIIYSDPVWKSGKSMLSEGENALGLSATQYGNDPHQFVVSALLLPFAVYAIPIPIDWVDTWSQWCCDFDAKLRNFEKRQSAGFFARLLRLAAEKTQK